MTLLQSLELFSTDEGIFFFDTVQLYGETFVSIFAISLMIRINKIHQFEMSCLFVLILFIASQLFATVNIAALGNTGGGISSSSFMQKRDRRQDYCMSDMFKRCLLKNEVGFYGIFVNGGNPCFVYNRGRVSTKVEFLFERWYPNKKMPNVFQKV